MGLIQQVTQKNTHGGLWSQKVVGGAVGGRKDVKTTNQRSRINKKYTYQPMKKGASRKIRPEGRIASSTQT